LRVDRADQLAEVGTRVGSAEEEGLVLVHTLYVSHLLLLPTPNSRHFLLLALPASSTPCF
jgi:hypothetical protein